MSYRSVTPKGICVRSVIENIFLPKRWKIKHKIGIFCAIAGVVSVQAGMTPASADTLNGNFGFALQYAGFSRANPAPQIKFLGSSLTTATKISIPTPSGGLAIPTAAHPFLQLVTTVAGTTQLPNTWFGFANDFTSLGGSGMDFGSIVSLSSQVLNVSHINGGQQFLFPPPVPLLSFGGDAYDATGTTPNQRFSFGYDEYSWTAISSVDSVGTVYKNLVGTFTGFIEDSQSLLAGGYDITAASVQLTFSSICVHAGNCTSPILVGELETSLAPTHNQHVPEPVSVTLFGLGLFGLAAVRHRRKS